MMQISCFHESKDTFYYFKVKMVPKKKVDMSNELSDERKVK